MPKFGFLAKASAFVVLALGSAVIYYYFSRRSPVVKSPQELAIESKGLSEFDAENNKTETVSSENKKYWRKWNRY